MCGHGFNWGGLVLQRVATAFRVLHPENPARAAAEILRRGAPVAVGEVTVPDDFVPAFDIPEQVKSVHTQLGGKANLEYRSVWLPCRFDRFDWLIYDGYNRPPGPRQNLPIPLLFLLFFFFFTITRM